MEEIVNRVAKSTLRTIDLEDYLDQTPQAVFDIKLGLFQGIMLREAEFRTFIREHDWSQYADKNIAVCCSEDAIIPSWAYMLVVTKLQPVAKNVVFGDENDLEKRLIDEGIEKICLEDLTNAKVVIKGCGEIKNRDYAYFELTRKLMPTVSSIMYGEPCSTVPVFKKK